MRVLIERVWVQATVLNEIIGQSVKFWWFLTNDRTVEEIMDELISRPGQNI